MRTKVIKMLLKVSGEGQEEMAGLIQEAGTK